MTGENGAPGQGAVEEDLSLREEQTLVEQSPQERQKARDDLLAYAFRALAGRALTEAELRTRLLRRTQDGALAAEVLARVQELGYQNDEGVARAEGHRGGVGEFRVRQTLKRRGVAAPLIEDILAARDPEQEQRDAAALLERRWSSLARKRDPRASAYAFLARRGFGGSVFWAALREVTERQGELGSAGEDPVPDVPDPDFPNPDFPNEDAAPE